MIIPKNPKNINAPGSMFRSPIFPKAILAAFYGKGKNDSYGRHMEKTFNEDGGFPLVTIALIGAAVRTKSFFPQYVTALISTCVSLLDVLPQVLCCIDEWKTGEHRTIAFTKVAYGPAFTRLHESLLGWKSYTERSESFLTKTLQKELLENAR